MVVHHNPEPQITSAAVKRSPKNQGPFASWPVTVLSMVSKSP